MTASRNLALLLTGLTLMLGLRAQADPIPVEALMSFPVFTGLQISPDGKTLAAVLPEDDL